MNKQEAKERIEKLKELINRHRYLYHVLDQQEISDSALDSLKKELFDLEQIFPDLISKDSPTQRVGGVALDKFKKTRHPSPMLSFQDSFSREDMEEWLSRIKKILSPEEAGEIDFYCEPKIDGLAIELIYEQGILKTGSTRGDGIIGEDVSPNLKTIEAVPLKLRTKDQALSFLSKKGTAKEVLKAVESLNLAKPFVVRGEVFIQKEEFERVNKKQDEVGLPRYSNPRNLAAGSLRQLDSKITAKRHLDSFCYEIVSDIALTNHEQKHQLLQSLGFKVNPHNKYEANLDGVISFHKYCLKLREKLSYEIDGIVVIVNSNNLFRKLGVVGKAPRGAVAFKFPVRQAATVVEDIKIQVGRTGVLTPVASLKPVNVGGVNVARATLHNEDEIKKLGLKIGDTVIVGRAGDVIPDIIKVLKELRTGKEKDFTMPSKCPACFGPVEKLQGEALLKCRNPNCFAKKRELFYHFVSRGAFDVQGLGPKIINQLIKSGLVSNPAGLFLIDAKKLVPLERFAEKSAENLVKAIQEKKKISLGKFIYSLGILHIGEKTAEDLAKHFCSLERLKKASVEDLTRVRDIGPVAARSVNGWFFAKENIKFLSELFGAGVKIKSESRAGSKKLEGLTFVFTGSLEGLSREKAAKMVRDAGGKVQKSVSKKTGFLVVGKNPGSKQKEAESLGIKQISENAFLKIVS